MPSESSKHLTDQVTACILAGGKGSRFGGIDKGFIKVADKYLIEHCLEKIKPQVMTTLISANRNFERYRALGCLIIRDSFGSFEGPLAGFLTALEQSKTPYLVTVPTDAPLFPSDLVKHLLQPIIDGQARASVARAGDKLHPTFCCLPVNSADSLRQYLRSGERKIITWLDQLDLKMVDFKFEKQFTNINKRDDLITASNILTNDKNI